MSSDPAVQTKEIVDDFDSGFTGTEVMRTVPIDYVEPVNEDFMGVIDPRTVDAIPIPAATTPEEDAASFADPDKAPAAASGDRTSATPEADSLPKTMMVPVDEYNQLVSTVSALNTQFGEHGRKLDNAFGKIGGVERFIEGVQKATPTGEAIVLSDDDMKTIAENFPSLSKDLQGVLNTALAKVKGTGVPVVQTVDDERINNLVAPMIEAERARARSEQREEVLDVHPDMDTVKDSAEFKKWFGEQPEAYRQKANTWRPTRIIAVLNDFKAAAKASPPPPAKDTRAEALAAAVNVRGSRPAPTGGGKKTDDDEFNAGFASG